MKPSKDHESDLDSVHEQGKAKPDIFLFEDHKAFLREYFIWAQDADPSLSHRKLAKQAGYANPGYFNDIVKGKRRIGAAGMERFAKALGMTHAETEYLVCLLTFQDAADLQEKDTAYEVLVRRRNRRFFKRLGTNQSMYYLDFNYPLIRAAIEVCDFQGDYKTLGNFLRPNMSHDSVKRYVRDLCDWGLVVQSSDGSYKVTHSYLEPPSGQRFAMSRMYQAWQAQTSTVLASLPPPKVHVSTAIITISENTYKGIMKQIGKFRDEVLTLVKADHGAELVASLSIQFLPRGENETGRKKHTPRP